MNHGTGSNPDGTSSKKILASIRGEEFFATARLGESVRITISGAVLNRAANVT
jgi:hypothetical protein